jgi:hypothetical protein
MRPQQADRNRLLAGERDHDGTGMPQVARHEREPAGRQQPGSVYKARVSARIAEYALACW